MKVTCTRDALLTAMQLVSSATAPRSTRPVLVNVKAVAYEDALVLMGTDMEVGIRYELRGVKVDRPGSAILPPQRLISILRECRDEEIPIDAEPERTRIKLSSGKFELLGANPDEFPDIPGFEDISYFHEITAGVLQTLLKRTAFAAEKKESTRWAVTGVLWEAEAGVARLVATDTRRLALTEGPVHIRGEAPERPGSHLIPVKTIGILERILHDEGELVRVGLKTNEALFQTERALIHTRLVEGRFPPYRDIIPKSMATKFEVPAAELLAAVRQAAITAEDESKRVEFFFQPGQLTLSARGADTGSSEVILPLPNYQGPEIQIAFDSAYVAEMLRVVEGEPTVTLELTDGTKPALFRVGTSYLYLVMPLAI